MVKLEVNASKSVRTWPRIEKYQNSTLRYSPPSDFPEFYEASHGRPKIMRCWITLDEVWDYRTDEYFWDYQIGVNRYKDDPNHYDYDWPSTVPSQTHFIDYLTSHSKHCDEVMFNIRRYERETADGIVSLDKYEEVVEKVISYYKELCPNIHYIEVSNESEIRAFGGITVPQYYELYKRVYRVVRRLNRKNNYETPLRVGGTAMTSPMHHPHLWYRFLQLLANDTDSERMIDFYSAHDYHPDISRLSSFYNMHHAWIKELNLPNVPIFFNEYGTVGATPILTDSLKNASGTLSGMILGSKLEGMYIFPWCTYHNPNMQMSYTQYLQLDNGKYVSTPNGNAMKMFSMLKEYELESSGRNQNRAVATGDGVSVAVLVTNPTNKPMAVDIMLKQIPHSRVTITKYLVDTRHNNRLTGQTCNELMLTDRWNEWVRKEDAGIDIDEVLDKYGFCLWLIEPYMFPKP